MLHFVVPFYNNESSLAGNARALHAVLSRDFPGAFELVLCDDGSTDGSLGVARALAAELPSVRIVGYPENRGRGYAVRYAAATCGGERLIFSDLDLPQTTDLGLIRKAGRGARRRIAWSWGPASSEVHPPAASGFAAWSAGPTASSSGSFCRDWTCATRTPDSRDSTSPG